MLAEGKDETKMILHWTEPTAMFKYGESRVFILQ